MKDGKTEREIQKRITKNIPYTEAPSIGEKEAQERWEEAGGLRFRVSTDFVKIPARAEGRTINNKRACT